jgi:hypothetical protein
LGQHVGRRADRDVDGHGDGNPISYVIDGEQYVAVITRQGHKQDVGDAR